jgi:pyruvate dehydrogenase E2 component (dihydrolipoamide acetyltransferase)
MTTFNLPDLGEGLMEAEVVTWHVSAGDHVITDQPLVSDETDKAVVEIPSPHSGTIVKVHAAAGDLVETGAPLVDIEIAAARDAGAVVGDLPAAEPEAPPPTVTVLPAPAAASPRVNAAPAVRRLAKELGVDLASVSGSGPAGAILSTDIHDAANGLRSRGELLRGVRRAMAKAMTVSGSTVVPASLTDQADIGAWVSDENPMLRLIRAICRACAAVPVLNAGFDGERLKPNAEVDLAIAVDTPDGLFAPVLRHAGNLSPAELATKLAELKSAIRSRSIAPAALKGGTITLSNFGVIGGVHAVLVVSPPQVAILGAGRIHDAVLAIDNAPEVRRVLPLSLSFDHRAVTGGEAARFMQVVLADLARAD